MRFGFLLLIISTLQLLYMHKKLLPHNPPPIVHGVIYIYESKAALIRTNPKLRLYGDYIAPSVAVTEYFVDEYFADEYFVDELIDRQRLFHCRYHFVENKVK